MNESSPPPARERILAAATEIVKKHGTSHMSLEAVAARAGVSKGGLLYHFPSKAKLLEAIVEDRVRNMRRTIMAAAEADETPANSCARAYIKAFRQECGHGEPPPSGILAAIAENPEFIDPIRRFQKEIVEQFRQQCVDPRPAIAAFLAIEGMRCLELFDAEVLTAAEREAIVDYLVAQLGGSPAPT